MARKRRICGNGIAYHITTRCVHRKFLFSDEMFPLILAVVRRAKEKYDFKVCGYCLMHNHYHLVIETRDDSVSAIMHHINGQIARQINLRLGFKGHLWESRYRDSIIETNSYLLEVLAYVHLNSVRAGIVEKAEDYPWSSYRRYISDEPNDLVDFPEIYYQLSKRPERCQQMVREVTERKGYTKNYRSLLTRQPDLTERIFYGSPKFVERMARAHAHALEPLARYRRKARRRDRNADRALRKKPKAE